MTRHLISVLLLPATTLLHPPEISAQWFPQTVPSGVSLLLSIDFASTQNGVAGGYFGGGSFSGRAIHTSDGGTTWTLAQVPDSARALVAVQMVGGGLGYFAGAYNTLPKSLTRPFPQQPASKMSSAAAARAAYLRRIGFDGSAEYNGLFLKTTDDGRTWFTWHALPESTYYLHAISFLDTDTGVVTSSRTESVGRAGILRTTDGGVTWRTIPISDSIVSLPAIQFCSRDTALAAGYRSADSTIEGVILRSTNGGLSWEESDFPAVDNFTGLAVTGRTTAYVSGVTTPGKGVVYKTTDAGVSWSLTPFGGEGTLLDGIVFAKDTPAGIVYGWAMMPVPGVFVARTTDGGTTWRVTPIPETPTGTLLTGGLLIDGDNGYLSGGNPFGNPLILHTTNGGVTFAGNDPGPGVPDTPRLWQNYPNPFNLTTVITFRIQNSEPTILTVFDLLGRDIATLVDDVKEPGTYLVRFDATGLATGVYHCRLKTGNTVLTRPMVLLK